MTWDSRILAGFVKYDANSRLDLVVAPPKFQLDTIDTVDGSDIPRFQTTVWMFLKPCK